jgi:hypothetical protein
MLNIFKKILEKKFLLKISSVAFIIVFVSFGFYYLQNKTQDIKSNNQGMAPSVLGVETACSDLTLEISKKNICGGTSHLGATTGSTYLSYQLPTSSYYTLNENGESPGWHQWGRKDLIEVIYYVAQQWSKRHPDEIFSIGDLDYPPGHLTHECGLDVDIFSTHSLIMRYPNGTKNPNYKPALAIELAELFLSTKSLTGILYGDNAVISKVNTYINANKLPGYMSYYSGHENHFHVRIYPNRFNCPSLPVTSTTVTSTTMGTTSTTRTSITTTSTTATVTTTSTKPMTTTSLLATTTTSIPTSTTTASSPTTTSTKTTSSSTSPIATDSTTTTTKSTSATDTISSCVETELGCIPNDPAGFVSKFYGIGLSMIGGISILFIIYGGYIILTSQGNPDKIKNGKSYVIYAVIGLFLAIFGFVLIKLVVVDILHIPGFE